MKTEANFYSSYTGWAMAFICAVLFGVNFVAVEMSLCIAQPFHCLGKSLLDGRGNGLVALMQSATFGHAPQIHAIQRACVVSISNIFL